MQNESWYKFRISQSAKYKLIYNIQFGASAIFPLILAVVSCIFNTQLFFEYNSMYEIGAQ